MATPKKRKLGQRRITIGEFDYTWGPAGERKRWITIRHADGYSGAIHVMPLYVLMPRHIAKCVEFATCNGWNPESNEQFWLVFKNVDVEDVLREVSPNEPGEWNSGRWVRYVNGDRQQTDLTQNNAMYRSGEVVSSEVEDLSPRPGERCRL